MDESRTEARTPIDSIPDFVREIVEEIAFHARSDQKVDRRSGVSQRLPITTLENVVSNAERRAFVNGESVAVPRVSDIYASLPSLTGKIELEYEGELKGAETVARELVRQAMATVFDGHATQVDRGRSSNGSRVADRWSSPTRRRRTDLLEAVDRGRRRISRARRLRLKDAPPRSARRLRTSCWKDSARCGRSRAPTKAAC